MGMVTAAQVEEHVRALLPPDAPLISCEWKEKARDRTDADGVFVWLWVREPPPRRYRWMRLAYLSPAQLADPWWRAHVRRELLAALVTPPQ